MIVYNTFDDFRDRLISKFNNINWSPILPAIREVIKTSIDRNFSEGGRFGDDNDFGGGNQKWIVSKASERRSGQTLVDTGRLASSVTINISYSGNKLNIEVGSNLPYAAIHQFGGVIKQGASSKLYTQNRYSKGKKKGSFKKGTTWGQGGTVGEHTITVPARPYLVLQNEDIEEIKKIVSDHIFKVIFN